ncbi:MAG TPA: hypothetical protein VE172_18005 [Stackebrandtia sp.]|jgi:hypothetical protein|uniref:hypothetical protein n=1 Tax=Stackebrandtia sp. TaxID=2023065 RepID=UPI002D43134F|nr:hypothetical protein [Stackebrandtia sp.]HZE40700.1 hypothetical protein [Stackebrandtia sp.]
MSKFRRAVLLTVPALALGLAGAAIALPAHAQPDHDDGGSRHLTAAEKLTLEHADVDPDAPLQFGTDPLADVKAAAESTAGSASCQIGADDATALSIAMTWPETSPSGEPPSPMTLSRYDTQPSLGDPEGRAAGLWFHPGIGMWQLDSAGLGTDFTAGEAMDAKNAADRMVPFIVGKYCDAVNSGSAPADARASAWSDWVACNEGACEDVYNRVLNEGVTPVDGVGQYGGGEQRDCDFGGQAMACLFVDPAKAQGANWWADPAGGRSPVAAPFYVYRVGDGDNVSEVRYWLAADSGASTDVQATRPFGSDARGGLTWAAGAGLCDKTAHRGGC